jgi:glucose-6-phosphate-specific signal transduction histidine kinase
MATISDAECIPPLVKTPQPHPCPAALIDLAIVAGVVVGFFSLSVNLELFERVSHWTQGYERWQVDELPLTLLLLSAGLSWFGWRRWRELAVEMRARRLVEETNLRMLAQNRQLARQLIQLQEKERRHLARELHDELGQCCVAIKVDAASIAQDTRDRLPLAFASARAIAATADHLHDVVRGMLQRLRPTGLDDLGLVACLQVLVESWSQRHGIACTFAAEGALDDFDEVTNVALYRTVQESLTNIARHAHAAQASVTIRRPAADASGSDCITLTIEDNGAGIRMDSIRNGLGVLGMSERVDALGGSLSFPAGPLGGTRIEAVLPVPIKARSAA